MRPLDVEGLHQDVGWRYDVVEYVGRNLCKCNEQEGNDGQELAAHQGGEYDYRVAVAGCCGYQQADQTHEQSYRENRNCVDAAGKYGADVLLDVTGVVGCVDDHGGVDAQEGRRCCPERHAPSALDAGEHAVQLGAEGGIDDIQHVDQDCNDEYAGDVLQPLNALKALDCQSNLQNGEQRIDNRQVVETEQDLEAAVDCAGADPALIAEPDDCRQSAEDARNLNTDRAEAAAQLNREADAVLVAGNTDDCQCNCDDRTADCHGEDCLEYGQRADQACAHGERTDRYTAAHKACAVGKRVHDTFFGWQQVFVYTLCQLRSQYLIVNDSFTHIFASFFHPSFTLSF